VRIVISNVFGSSNRGDALLVEALHASIRDAFGADVELAGIAHFPDLERSHLPDVSWSTPPARSYAANRWVRRGVNAARTVGALSYGAVGAPDVWPFPPPSDQRRSIQALRDADLVVSCAGGFLLDVNASILGNLMQMNFAHRFGTPLILAPQTIGPIRSPRLRRLTYSVLSKAKLICAREQYTYDFLVNDLGLPASQVLRTTDIAFEHGRVDAAGGAAALGELGISADERFIGATIVDWAFPASPSPAQARADYQDKVVGLLTRLHGETGRRILLFNQVSSDLRLGREVAARCGGAVVQDVADRSTPVMRGMIERADVFLGSRFHSCVFALLGRTPTVSLAYTYKSTGIMQDLGLADRVHEIDGFDAEVIRGQILKLLADPEAERGRINQAIETLAFPRFADVLRDFAASHLKV
jgi:colanic acid/amylovoran biosynthesis protein